MQDDTNLGNLIAEINNPEDGQGQEAEFSWPEGVKPEEFNAQLEKVTGGKYADFTALQQQLGERENLLGKIAELQNQDPPEPKFANEYHKQLHEMFMSGKEAKDINEFVRLQTMPIDDMDPIDILTAKVRMESPGLNKQDIQFAIDDMIGSERPDKDDYTTEDAETGESIFNEDKYNSAMRRYESTIKRLATRAKSELEAKRLDMSKNDIITERQEAERRAQDAVQGWYQVAQSVNKPMSFEFEGKEIGGKYDFSFNPPSDQRLAEANKMVAQMAAQAGLSFEKDSIPKLMDLRDTVYFTMFRKEFLNHLVIDMYSSLLKANINQARFSGTIPQGSDRKDGSVQQPTSRYPAPGKGYV